MKAENDVDRRQTTGVEDSDDKHKNDRTDGHMLFHDMLATHKD